MGKDAGRAKPGQRVVPGDARPPTPPSGVRASSALGRTLPSGISPVILGHAVRPQLDSQDMTRVNAPTPLLLALARGQRAARRRRQTPWFIAGSLLGAVLVWVVTGDARGDVYGARLWIATTLRSLHGQDAKARVEPDAPETPASPGATAPVDAIPVVDVKALPKTGEAGSPTASPAPPTAGTPALMSAPGPR